MKDIKISVYSDRFRAEAITDKHFLKNPNPMSIDIDNHQNQYSKNLQQSISTAVLQHLPEITRVFEKQGNVQARILELKLLILTFNGEILRLERENNKVL